VPGPLPEGQVGSEVGAPDAEASVSPRAEDRADDQQSGVLEVASETPDELAERHEAGVAER
jgi:hypothetical protein